MTDCKLSPQGLSGLVPDPTRRRRPAAGLPTVVGVQSGTASIIVCDADPRSLTDPAIQMLCNQGFELEHVLTLDAAEAAFAHRERDLLIMDLGPEGLAACLRFSRAGRRVIIFSAKADALLQVSALEAGADDYVAKSAHPLELVARVRAVLRRGVREPPAPARDPIAPAACWRFDGASGIVTGPSGRAVRLTGGSRELLSLLIANPGAVLHRPHLARILLGPNATGAARAIDVRVSRLRRSLDSCDGAGRLVRTLQGVGFLLDAAVEDFGMTVTLRSAPPRLAEMRQGRRWTT